MFSKLVTVSTVALASSVAAQTFSSCNPVKGDKCPADKAVGGTVVIDFTQGANDFFDVAGGTTLTYDPVKGAVFTIKEDTNAPTITSKQYIFFGRVEVEVQASVGTGVVTSAVLESDCLDEIDWEWLGGDTTEVQTNYFSKGDTSTYDRGGFSPVSTPQTGFHTYTIDWTSERVEWIIDGTVVRTLTYAAAKGGATFPQTPMQIKLGTWVAGKQGAPQGTVTWAGGYTNFANAPFYGYYRKVTVTDYSNGVKGAKSYSYGDTTGTFGSIKVSTDGSNSADVNVTSSGSASSTSASSKPTTLTQASNSTAKATGTGSGSGPTSTGSGNGSPSSTANPNSGMRTAANVAALGAAFFLSYLVL